MTHRSAVTRRNFLGAAAGAAALSAAGALAPRRARAQQLTELKVGVIPSVSYAGIFLADDLGYFRESGITPRYERVVTGAEGMAHLAAGNLDVLGGGLGASTFNALLRGLEVRLVANKGYYPPGLPSDTKFMVRTELYKKGIRAIKDLKGLKIALNATANVTHYHVANALEQAGLTENDVQIVTVPLPEMVAAMRTGAVDATEIWEPFTIELEQTGIAQVMAHVGDVLPGHHYAHILYGGPFMKRRQLAQAFMDCYIRGVRKYYELGPYSDPVVASLEKHTRQKPDMIRRMTATLIEINGDVDVADIEKQQAWFIRKGMVARRIEADRLVDKSFLQATWAKHGRLPALNKESWEKLKTTGVRS